MVAKFYEDAELDTVWQDIAQKDVGEPEEEEEVAEKLEKAMEFKDVGNSAYKEGNYKVAAKNYHKAILYLKVNFQEFY